MARRLNRGFYAQPLGYPYQLREGTNSQFADHPPAVDLDILFAGTKFERNIFVHLSGDDVFEYLALTRRKLCQPFTKFDHLDVVRILFLSASNRREDGSQQVGRFHRLCQEIFRASLHRFYAGLNVAVTSKENDRESHAVARESALYFQAVDAGHRQVQDQAGGIAGLVVCEKILSTLECQRLKAIHIQYARQCFEHVRFVVEEIDYCVSVQVASVAMGSDR